MVCAARELVQPADCKAERQPVGIFHLSADIAVAAELVYKPCITYVSTRQLCLNIMCPLLTTHSSHYCVGFRCCSVNIPFKTFAVGSFIGLQPLNFISVSAGRTLGKMRSLSDLYSARTLLTMCACACVALLPAALKQIARRQPQLIGLGLRSPNTASAVL